MKKRINITVLTSEEATKLRTPKYNAYACGYGVHGDTKYNRAKVKRIPFDY